MMRKPHLIIIEMYIGLIFQNNFQCENNEFAQELEFLFIVHFSITKSYYNYGTCICGINLFYPNYVSDLSHACEII